MLTQDIKGGMNQQQKISFIRIFLCQTSGFLCYVIMTSGTNKRIFHQDLLQRDNGIITIGLHLRLVTLYPIKRNIQGILLVRTHYPAITLEEPDELPLININTYIQANQSGVVMLKMVDVEIRRTTPIQTNSIVINNNLWIGVIH